MTLLRSSRIIRRNGITVLVGLALMALTAPALAGPQPVILATYADLGAATLTIHGQNFGSGVPVVKLAGQPLVVQQSSSTEIVAALPPGLTEGSYLLRVKKAGSAEVTLLVTVDVDAVSDGPGREIQDFASATGGGPIPDGTMRFFATPVAITTTKPTQPVLVVASNAFGTAASPANSLNLFVCYQALDQGAPSDPVVPVGNGIVGLRQPAFVRVVHSVNKIIRPPAAGTYQVGMCGNSGSANWNDNDWGMTSALVF